MQNPPFPPETFGNLLLLYCKPTHQFYDLAADVMAENQHLTYTHLSRDLYDYLEATILRQTVPEVRPKILQILIFHRIFLSSGLTGC
jgi:tetratricopeptide repeat protein 30